MSQRPVTIESQDGWQRVTTPWHPALRPLLRGYVGYRYGGLEPARMRTLPTGDVTVIISLVDPLRMVATSYPGFHGASYPALLAGMDDGPGCYEHGLDHAGIQIDLTPLGTYRLLGVPMHEMTNQAVDLAYLLGHGADSAVARLVETPSWGDRFDLLDGLLLQRLAAGPDPAPEVGEAWRLLTGSGGLVPVSRLADEVGWSRKHLVNRFKEQIGLPPKTLARVLRFRRALDLLGRGVPGFADVAAACGYYDQAHLIREFKSLSGCTPGELMRARAGDGPTVEIPLDSAYH